MILDDVKKALRIVTNAYDSDIQTYINTCYYDLERMGIQFDKESPDPEIINAVIIYTKSVFGTGNESYKEQLFTVYNNLCTKLITDNTKYGGD